MVTTDLSQIIGEIKVATDHTTLIQIINSEGISNLMWSAVERAGVLYTSQNPDERTAGKSFFDYAVNARDRDFVTYACEELVKAGKTASEIKSEFYTGQELPGTHFLGAFFARGSFSHGLSEGGYL
ncbi:MAG: hypothetical protein AABX51_05230 [Nanoarchaeota archaeon]